MNSANRRSRAYAPASADMMPSKILRERDDFLMFRKYSCVLSLLLSSACGHTEQLDLSRLKLPEGFHITVFATAPNARMLAFSPGGVLLVTDMSDGKVLSFPDPKRSYKAERTVTVLADLNAPHGI